MLNKVVFDSLTTTTTTTTATTATTKRKAKRGKVMHLFCPDTVWCFFGFLPFSCFSSLLSCAFPSVLLAVRLFHCCSCFLLCCFDHKEFLVLGLTSSSVTWIESLMLWSKHTQYSAGIGISKRGLAKSLTKLAQKPYKKENMSKTVKNHFIGVIFTLFSSYSTVSHPHFSQSKLSSVSQGRETTTS
jgi:hypothetical protein